MENEKKVLLFDVQVTFCSVTIGATIGAVLVEFCLGLEAAILRHLLFTLPPLIIAYYFIHRHAKSNKA